MEKLLLFFIWLILVVSLWTFATSLTVNEPFKRHEFKFKSLAYWLACGASFLIGMLF